MKIIIVGGVAGGASAAARLRRLSETDEIILFEKDEYISFANCGLPYYIGDIITDRDQLLVQTVEGMRTRFNLDIRNFQEVVSINKEDKTLAVFNHQSKETYVESYDKLILSPGANPIWPSLPGMDDAKNVFKLRNIPDMDKIKASITSDVKKAVVIGGGFIGVEMAENLKHLGLEVTLIDLSNQVLAPLDYEMAAIIQNELTRQGIVLKLEAGIESFSNAGKVLHLTNQETIESDVTILAIGVVPSSILAKQAGLQLGLKDAIVVNESLQTSDPNIYAIGDVIQVNHIVSNTATYIPLAWPANRQGRLVADQIHGKEIAYKGSLGSSVAKVFDMVAASTGINEKTAKQLGMEYKTMIVHRNNHAGYYPQATNLSLKVVYNPSTLEILGAQAVGFEGSEKRIDVIATAILSKLKVIDLASLELCYAPPFSSAKDPVNILGYAVSHEVEKRYQTIRYDELVNYKDLFILDVRTPLEYNNGHLDHAINIELDTLRTRLNELPSDKNAKIVVYCRVGQRAHYALCILQNAGYTNLYNLIGGYLTYDEVKQAQINNACKVETYKPLDEDTQVLKEDLSQIAIDVSINACGLQCPGPIVQTFKALENGQNGQVFEIKASDYGFANDIKQWCTTTNNELLHVETKNGTVRAIIRKGLKVNQSVAKNTNRSTIVLFSGEMDKAMAAMIIAAGSASIGQEVTIFFTFWGLNALRKKHVNVKVKKSTLEKMFSIMMPKGASKLGLSKMNFAGVGKHMMKKIMKDKNVDDLETLMASAQKLGVKFIACTMSMDVMGIKQEELIDGIEYGGVASYVSDSAEAGLTLFI